MFGRSDRFHTLRMGLWHGMLRRLIVLRAIDWPKLSLAGYAAFELRLHFPGAALLERIGASAAAQHPRDCEQERQAFHLLILGRVRPIAREAIGLRIDSRALRSLVRITMQSMRSSRPRRLAQCGMRI